MNNLIKYILRYPEFMYNWRDGILGEKQVAVARLRYLNHKSGLRIGIGSVLALLSVDRQWKANLPVGRKKEIGALLSTRE